MSIISSLTVVLGTDTADFDAGMKRSSQVTREMNRDARAAFQSTRTVQEQFTASTKRLNEIHAAGKISAETHARALNKLEAEYKQGAAAANRFGDAAGHVRSALAVAGIGVGISEAVNFLKSSYSAFEEARQEQVKLATSLESTGFAAGFSSEALAGYASGLQRVTNFDDDAIAGAEGVLATFTKIKGLEFTDTVQAMLDLSAKMGQDLQTSAVQLGKALNDPIRGLTALRRVGVSFTADQEAVIKAFVKTGDIVSAQRVILAELKTEFGGTAAAMRNELTGLKNDWGDLKEAIGALGNTSVVTGAVGALAQSVRDLSGSLNTFSEAPGFWNFVEAYGKLFDLGNPLMLFRTPEAPELKAPTPDMKPTTPKADLSGAGKDAADFEAGLAKLTAEFEKNIATMGMSANEIKLWELAQKGATEAELADVRALMDQADKMKAAGDASRKFEADQRALIESLQKEILLFGKTAEEIRLFNLETAAGPEGIDPMIRALMEERDALEANAKAAREAKDAIASMMDEGKRLHDSLLTPTERYEKELAHLNELFQAGAIDEEDMGRATKKLQEDLDRAIEKRDKADRPRPQANIAIQAGTREAFDAINRANEGLLAAAAEAKAGQGQPGGAAALRRPGADLGRNQFGRIPKNQRQNPRRAAGQAKQADANREKIAQQQLDVIRREEILLRTIASNTGNTKVWEGTG